MRRPLRVVLAVLLLLTLTLMITGCAELVDIDKKALAIVVGLDAGTTSAPVSVSMQYVIPATSGGGASVLGGGGASSEAVQGVSVCDNGSNVDGAFRRLRAETDRFVYLGNLSVILIGRALAERGVEAPLDYLVRDGQIAEATQIAIVAGNVCDFLRAPYRSHSPTRMPVSASGVGLPLYDFLRQSERTNFPTSPNVLWRFLGPIYSHNRASFAPMVETSSQGQPFRAAGTALFVRGKLVGAVTGYQEVVLDWLLKSGGWPDAQVNLTGSQEPAALRIGTRHFSIDVVGPDEVALRLQLGATIREGNGIALDSKDAGLLDREASTQLQDQVRGVLDTLQRDRADVLGVSDYMLASYPAEAKDWPATFSRLRLDLYVSVLIHAGGRKT